MKRSPAMIPLGFLLLAVLCLFSACAPPVTQPLDAQMQMVFMTEGESRLHAFAPVFVIEQSGNAYNLVGTPTAEQRPQEGTVVLVDPGTPSIYAEERTFKTEHSAYTNLLYRVHFEKVPAGHLTAGQNVGLLVLITLDQNEQPVLVTTVHTCGCYLGMLSTSYLADDALPQGWNRAAHQIIYGQSLPMNLDFAGRKTGKWRLVLQIEGETHRVKDVWLKTPEELAALNAARMSLKPLASLERLLLAGAETSFFVETGPLRGYVKGSSKPWEKLLISWWSLDWHVGEDKMLGRDKSEGPAFYTSLKPWARDASDLRNFAAFLKYWGWQL